MAWDSSRPVPWARLFKEWAVYVGLLVVLFVAFARDSSPVGIVIGLVLSLPLYVGLGAVLAKLGVRRRTLREARAEAAQRRGDATATGSGHAHASAPARPKPAPTRRTGGASGRPGGNRKPR